MYIDSSFLLKIHMKIFGKYNKNNMRIRKKHFLQQEIEYLGILYTINNSFVILILRIMG